MVSYISSIQNKYILNLFFIPFPIALLVLIWVITRLASDVSGSRVDRASSLQERARVRHIT